MAADGGLPRSAHFPQREAEAGHDHTAQTITTRVRPAAA